MSVKIIKNNYKEDKSNRSRKIDSNKSITVRCKQCDSELEITEIDTHIGWLGARFITCPCCGEESMVDEFDGITLTKDNLKFPVHFKRVAKGLGYIAEISPDKIVEEINKAVTYFRENKDEWCWYTSYGDLFLVVFRLLGDEEYFVVTTKDFYETDIPFEAEDYE